MKEVKLLVDDDGGVWLDGACFPLQDQLPLPILYTEDQVAEYFGVTKEAIRYWRKHGKIEFIQVNSTIRFTHDQLEAMLVEYTKGGWARVTDAAAS